MRWVGLLAVGAIALHELRYLVGPGAHAHQVAVSHMHSHLPLVIAIACMVFVASVVDFVAALQAANGGRSSVAAPSRLSRAWPAATLALVAVFVVQESLEGALFGGHTAGMHGLFGHGGWSVAILAPLLGAVIAFLVRGSEKAIELVARKRASRSRRKPARILPMRPLLIAAPRPSLIARNLAGRAPPPVSA
jgi:hypothetical protein